MSIDPLGQTQIFAPGCTLLDCTLEMRAAAVCSMLHDEPMTMAEREELLVLVCWPAAWSEVER